VNVFVHLSVHYPRPGREQDLADSMRRFGEAAEGVRGFREAHTLKDLKSGRLVGLALWEDEQSWRDGVEAMRAVVADDPFDEWEEREPEVFALTDVRRSP
jgi:heme-degrading monooxygenase HmoA